MTKASDLRLVRWGLGLSALAVVVVTVTLLMPGGSGPARIPGLDKLLHFLAFAGLVLPVAATAPRHAWTAAVLATAYGGAMELIQPSFGRGAEWADLLADGLGALAGAMLGRWLHPWLRRRLG